MGADALVERLFQAVLGFNDLHAVYLGDRLGLYRALHEGAETPTEVAEATATVFEAIHDLAKPVEALRAIRGLLDEDGVALVADERVADEFTAPGDEVERVMYGWSILHCLPVGRVEQPSAETGTGMRVSTFEGYAKEAGFGRVQVVPVEHDFWRFYRLER